MILLNVLINKIGQFFIYLNLILFLVNCTTSRSKTRLEKFSFMMEEEKEIYGDSISEFGKLKKYVEQSVTNKQEYIEDEYLSIHFGSGDFVEETCQNILNSKTNTDKEILEKVKNFILTKNVNLETLEKGFNYKIPEESRLVCNNIPKKNQNILDEILKLVSKLKLDLDDPKKGNRLGRLNELKTRIRFPNEKEKEEDKSELYKKKSLIDKKHQIVVSKVFLATKNEYFITRGTILTGQIFLVFRNITDYGPNIFTKIVASIFLIAVGNEIFSPRLNDRETISKLHLIGNIQDYYSYLTENEHLVKDTQYILIHDKENKIPGFDEILAAYEFRISNYENLNQFLISKNEIKFITEEIKKICESLDCNKKPDMKILKSEASKSIEGLKIQKNYNIQI